MSNACAKVTSVVRSWAVARQFGLGFSLVLASLSLAGGCGSAHEHHRRAQELAARTAERPATEPPDECSERPDAAGRVEVPFGVYAVPPASFAELRASGYTMVGPWYDRAVDRALLDAAHSVGLGVVVAVGADNEPYHRQQVLALDPDAAAARVRAQVSALADHPAVAYWYVMPEELRSWRAAEMDYLDAVVAAIAEADPHGRPIVGYQPNERGRDHLQPIAGRLGGLAKGSYANFAGHRLERAWVRWSAEELVATAAVPALAVVEMFEDPIASEHIASWTRHDVYAALASGATGVLVYSGAHRPGFTAHAAYADAYAAVARELAGELAIGDALVGGQVCTPRSLRIERGPATQRFIAAKLPRSHASVMVAERARGPFRWIFVINSAADPVVVALDPPPQTRPIVGADVAISNGDSLWLAPWAVAIWREDAITSPARGA